MGTVYRAEDTLLGRPVALKFPHPALIEGPRARERFLREAREGVALRERLRSAPLSVSEVVGIGRGIAEALAHAHARGVRSSAPARR